MTSERYTSLKTNAPLQGASIAVFETVKDYLVTGSFKVKTKKPLYKTELTVFFLIDSSGSMVRDQQMASVKGLIEKTLRQNRHKKIKFAAVALGKGEASLVSSITTEPQELLDSVKSLTTGGKTNLKAGFHLIHQLIKTNTPQHYLYIFTDGKINAGDTDDPLMEAITFYQSHLKRITETIVIDSEQGFIKLRLAEKLASALHATYIHVNHLTT